MGIVDDQSELFIVVDEDDNFLGYKTRAECHRDKSLIHRSIGIVISNGKGEVLLQKRSKYKDTYPGFYTVSVSGHVNKTDTYDEAARRELQEELGIVADLTFVDTYLSRMPNETEMIAVYTAVHNGPFVINKAELEKVDFFTQEEISRMKNMLTPGAQNSLKQVGIIL